MNVNVIKTPNPHPASPSDMAAVVAEISITLAVMPRQATAAADAGDIIKIYTRDLCSEFPASEIISALRDARLGLCGGPFAPTIGEIANHIRSRYLAREMAANARPAEDYSRIRLDRESAQGRAWDRYGKREGVSIIWAGGSHWYFPSEWPPGCDAEIAAREENEIAARRVSDDAVRELRRIVPGAFKEEAAE